MIKFLAISMLLSIFFLTINTILLMFSSVDEEKKINAIYLYSIILFFSPVFYNVIKEENNLMYSNLVIIFICFLSYSIITYSLFKIIKGILKDFRILRNHKFEDLKVELENYKYTLNEKGFFTVFGQLRNYENNTPSLFFSKDNQNWYMITILRKNRFITREFREAYSFAVIRNLAIDIMFADKNLNDENVEKIMNYSDSNFIREHYIVE